MGIDPAYRHPKLDEIISLRIQKRTMSEIGKLVGMSKQRVHQLLRRYRPDLLGDTGYRPVSVSAIAYTHTALDRLLTPSEIEAEKGWCHATQCKWFKQIGAPTQYTRRVLNQAFQVSPILWERFPGGRCKTADVQAVMKEVFGKDFSVSIARKVRAKIGMQALPPGRPVRDYN